MLPRLIHVITPGDHYSPRTGSAVPTVVHGLSAATPAEQLRPAVLVARGTYPDRYDSADPIEYEQRRSRGSDRYVDYALSRLVRRRPMARADYAASLVDQTDWDSAFILLHNAPAGVAAVDTNRHHSVLYAHNELLRTYSEREAGRALESATAIICVSDFMAERTSDRLPRSLRDRIAVVRNGADVSFFHPQSDPQSETDRPLQVLFVGRVIPDKGAHVLVDAALQVPGLKITIVGSRGFSADEPPTPYEKELRASLARLGPRATWLPFRPRSEVAEMMRAADVVVVPSVWPDPCPLTMFEGMASGAVVIGSRIGGIPETIADVGFLFPPGDSSALAAALRELDGDRGELRARRAAARDYAVANDWSATWRSLASALSDHSSSIG